MKSLLTCKQVPHYIITSYFKKAFPLISHIHSSSCFHLAHWSAETLKIYVNIVKRSPRFTTHKGGDAMRRTAASECQAGNRSSWIFFIDSHRPERKNLVTFKIQHLYMTFVRKEVTLYDKMLAKCADFISSVVWLIMKTITSVT